MNYQEKIKDDLRRAEIIESWQKRFDKLKKTKKMSIYQFCQKYGIEMTGVYHILAGRRGAKWESINKIQSALHAENV